VLVAAIGPGEELGTPASPRVASARKIALRGPLAVAGGPHGHIVLAATAPAGTTAGGLFTQGTATGPFSPAQATEGPAAPIALATAYLDDVAIASPVDYAGDRRGVRLRVERHHARGFAGPVAVSTNGVGPVESLRVALDYRSEALVVWRQGGAIYAREVPTSGPAHPIQRLASAGPQPRIVALLSDDGRGIVAWAQDRAGETSVYVDISAPSVRFPRPRLLERFSDPDGLGSPNGSPSLVRLSSESVMMAWAGSDGSRWVVRTAPIDLNGVREVSTISSPEADALLAALAPGPHGEALALWTEPQRTPQGLANLSRQAIFAARGIDTYRGLTIFGEPEQVAASGPNSNPTVAIDPDSDRAVAAWRGAGGAIDYAIRASSAP
jgi:hypothetical protein